MEIVRDESKTYRAGDRIIVERTISQIPSATFLSKAWFAVKEAFSDPDGDSLYFASITPTPNSDGEIEDIGDGAGVLPVGTGKVRFTIPPAKTREIGAKKRRYALKVLLDTGEPYTPEVGTMDLGEVAIEAEA